MVCTGRLATASPQRVWPRYTSRRAGAKPALCGTILHGMVPIPHHWCDLRPDRFSICAAGLTYLKEPYGLQKQSISCAVCNGAFMRFPWHIKKVVQKSGVWRCRSCANTVMNKARAKPEGAIRVVKASGYVEEKFGGKWVRQHRLVVERQLGRPLRDDEDVHHKNHTKGDNDPRNLELMDHGEHTIEHHTGAKRSALTAKKIAERARSRSSLLASDVAEIKQKVAAGQTQRAVARSYGVSPMTINRIINEATWRE
ncbi:HNH endonuclease [Burkholderia phage Bcep22]|uniref:HNH endonuclease n=1 Tax=Burkholderia phage Bcep22 TaxID=2883944 RepID=Q6V7S8_9CAUD|nr:HNH endonuclease [Burkholderia phage Bcep22]AAQ54950.2 HNH endonuclease [Burkholderia phage Bcep22]